MHEVLKVVVPENKYEAALQMINALSVEIHSSAIVQAENSSMVLRVIVMDCFVPKGKVGDFLVHRDFLGIDPNKYELPDYIAPAA